MKLFDVIGAVAVIVWLSVIGYFAYTQYIVPQSYSLEGGAVFREGESYMVLTREDEEVGYIHESRTRVSETDSWLLEYDLVMNISMLGIDQYLQTTIKATVNRAAVLERFSAAIETAGTTFDLTGEVDGSRIEMQMEIGGQPRTQVIELKEPPRLSNSALNELVANENLEPGMVFEQEYFDPTTMGMTTMTFEFVRESEIDLYDEKIPTFHFRQRVGGTELDAYVDEFGEVQLQEFPLRIVGARLPPELGRARAREIAERFQTSEKTGTATAANLSIQATMDLVRSGSLDAVDTSRYRIKNLPSGVEFDFNSIEQRVTRRAEGMVEIDTAERFDDVEPQANLEPFLASTLRVDAEDESFAELLAEDAPNSAVLRAEMITREVGRRLTVAPQIGIQTASAALATGSGDCTEFALVLVAALRHQQIPARFVSGVRLDEQGQFILHQWAQYWNGQRFVDVDPTTPTMMPSTSQIQLFTHAAPDKPELATVIGEIEIEKIVEDGDPDAAPSVDGVDSDFN